MVDLAELQTPESREEFFDQILCSGPDALETILAYYIATVEAMSDSGAFIEEEIPLEAAHGVFNGLARAVQARRAGDSHIVYTLDSLDQIFRKLGGIPDGIYPSDHEDPIVAAFYDELEGHLGTGDCLNRGDGWSRR